MAVVVLCLARIGGALLLAAGLYVAWYGAWELRVLHADAGPGPVDDPVVDAGGRLQRALATAVETADASGFILALAVLVAAALLWRRTRSGRRQQPEQHR